MSQRVALQLVSMAPKTPISRLKPRYTPVFFRDGVHSGNASYVTWLWMVNVGEGFTSCSIRDIARELAFHYNNAAFNYTYKYAGGTTHGRQ